MESTIKQRIEQINNGQVPEGYFRTTAGIIPQEWRISPLGLLLEFKNGVNADKEKYGSGVKMISVMDVLKSTPIHYNDIIGQVDIDENTLNTYCVNYGDILFQRSSETAEDAGKSNVYLDKEKTTYSGFVIRGKKKTDYCPYFLNETLKKEEVRKQLIRNAAGSQHINIGQESLEKIEVCLPSATEQEKIAEILMKWDEAIELYNQQIEKLNLLKSACIKKMFPKRKSKIPELRFKGFTQTWEQRKMGDVLQTVPFKLFIKTPEQDGKYEIIQQGNEPVIGYANGTPCTDFKDTVIFGDHTLSLYKPNKPFFVATDGVRIVKGKQNLNGFYLLALLEKYRPKSEGYKRYYSILTDCNCYITENETEQKKIGEYFRHIDNLITLHQRKVEIIIRQRKALQQYLLNGIVRVEV